MHAQQFPNPSHKSASGGLVRISESSSEHRVSAVRGLLIAGALATPVWLALYLLLR